MERECRVRARPAYSAIAFHAQQCAEKYLKARLCEAGRSIPRVHDLCALLDLVGDLDPSWGVMRGDLRFLTDFAVSYRYPGGGADRNTALDARRRCRTFRLAARRSLGLNP
jgi:HEPN domain-containing protein